MNSGANNKILKLIGIIFGIVSAVMIVISAVAYLAISGKVEECDVVPATITRIDSKIDQSSGSISSRAYVDYSYDGEKYIKVPLHEYISTMYEGKEIELYIDRDNPENISVKSIVIYLLPMIFAGIGVIFLIIASAFMIIIHKRKKALMKLMDEGKKVYGEIQGGEMNRRVTYGGKHPYILRCVYYDDLSGQPIICTSDSVWTNPDELIGQQIAIYVDRNDSSHYWVDIRNIK